MPQASGIRQRRVAAASRRLDDESPPRAAQGSVTSSLPAVTAIAVAIVATVVYFSTSHLGGESGFAAEPPAAQPLDAPKLADLPQFKGEHARRLLWGTYRPGLYFGMRMRQPRSLLSGLMWFDPQVLDGVGGLRHEAQERDGLRRYGWLRHDGATFGRQELHDGPYSIQTSFAKRLSPGTGPGGDWGVRLDADVSVSERLAMQQQGLPQRMVSFVFYMVEEDLGEAKDWEIDPKDGKYTHGAGDGAKRRVLIRGRNSRLGRWEVHGVAGEEANFDVRYMGRVTRHTHNLTDLVKQNLKRPYADPSQGHQFVAPMLDKAMDPGSNLAAFQFTAVLPFQVDLAFVSGVGDKGTPSANERAAELSGDKMSALLQEKEREWEGRFRSALGLHQRKGDPVVTNDAAEVAAAAVSNMLGGMGYFFGPSIIRDGDSPMAQLYWAAPLYSAVPSRSFFPRGFLWDEGFHQLLVSRWDPAISRDALAHWLDLINARGWIPREQILGAEARSRVPDEFVVQGTDNANPPTLFLPLLKLAERAGALGDASDMPPGEAEATRDFLDAALPRLAAWFGWFNRTQAGPVKGSFRWRGRDPNADRELNPKTLTSGLDDYPRASHPGQQERHLDLRCWMTLASRLMARVAAVRGPAEAEPYAALAETLSDVALLDKLHLHKKSGEYRDFGNHTDHVDLEWQPTWDRGQPRNRPPTGRALLRTTRGAPKSRLVPMFGYLSLFPFLIKTFPPDSDALGRQLDLLRDEGRLWTPYGLRSLAKNATLYGKHNTEHDAPYWRGPIWMNINYLALSSLHHYANAPGPHAERAGEMYRDLRRNLVGNVVSQYQKTGYLWENYDDGDGHGRGCRPFTGWTALIALIMAELY